ncbi:BN6_48550 family protein [Actinoplanes oblitus]|uniref:BN6_48550 family protein n=1 Tax=Actinoplanes oblitus TaxID=3040509 RepID=A0ABY8WBA1_9ACTN|nr:CATRA conflict system CASPASE/TPR repeat-associated protein [Actinoplanes oblitus]WIM94368.1 BN6_48550 family protein [Actinoplanes oblitus]
MTTSELVDQEFVAHLYAPLDGPDAATALAWLDGFWERCRTQLGMTEPILAADLAAGLPADPAQEPDGALAGLQDPALRCQAIVRREHDVLNVSFGISQRPGYALQPGWHDHARWWERLRGTDPGGLLGGAIVYLARAADPAGAGVRDAVPARSDDGAGWWTNRCVLNGFAAWEVTPTGGGPDRRLVIVGRPSQERALSEFAWSAGDSALPPLGRYLLHATKLRYHARVLDAGGLRALRSRVLDRVEPSGPADLTEYTADEAELVAALGGLRRMARSVEIARANLAKAVAPQLPADAELATWLADRIGDEVEYLEATREQAERTAKLIPEQRPPATAAARSGVEHRVGFGIDVVDYSSRTAPSRNEVQRRVAGMVERVLEGLGLKPHETDRQDAGDGMMVVLPAGVPTHLALPKLLHGWRACLVADNAAHPADRIRLRLAVGSGPFAAAAIGFSDNTIIGIGRLLDSPALRQAVVEHPDADVVALITDRTHEDVVGEGYEGLDANQFRSVEVRVKTFRRTAWLWTGGSVTPAAPAGPEPARREIFVIHGREQRARAAVFGLLRSLNLHPLDWEEVLARTGKPMPYREEVLRAGFAIGPASLVLLTPDDLDGTYPDTLIRAGQALASHPERTMVVRIGGPGRVTELDGREVVRLAGDTRRDREIFVQQIAQRLRIAGFPIDTSGTDWLDTDRFAGLL